MKQLKPTKYSKCWPYITLALSAVLAFAPVSLMLLTLKNDILAIDYPIKYFISECIRNGENPLWCNTWAMGFPLESILTWSVFSPLQFLFSLPGPYTLYLLHLEFTCYVMLAGWSMYYFLRTHTQASQPLHWILACAYMLSGFVVGSSQWFTYLTAAAFLPLSLAVYFNLVKQPNFRNALLLTMVGYVMLTSVYAAFLITLAYILFFITGIWIVRASQRRSVNVKVTLGYLCLSLTLLLFLATPALQATYHLLLALDRGKPLIQSDLFTQSNYVSVSALKSLLLPLANIRLQSPNTEGSMSHLYLGLVPLLLLPYSLRHWKQCGLLLAAILFLLLSMGMETPLRSWANWLPGFNYFRNPGLFRLFFVFFTLWHLGRHGTALLDTFSKSRRSILALIAILFLILLATLLSNGSHLSSLFHAGSTKKAIAGITTGQSTAVAALVQSGILLLAVIALYKKDVRQLLLVTAVDLIINTLICTPFYTVSSYTLPAAQQRLKLVAGFPIQNTPVNQVPTAIYANGANWYNIHVLAKQVAIQPSYYGPLFLKGFDPNKQPATAVAIPLLQIYSPSGKQSAGIMEQQPGYVKASIGATITRVRLQQHYYPGWKAYLNGKPLNIQDVTPSGMEVAITEGGRLEFVYEKNHLWYWAIGVNLVVIGSLLFLAFTSMRANELEQKQIKKSHVPG